MPNVLRSCWLAVLAAPMISLVLANRASAQLDTPAAAEARQAFRALRDTYRPYEAWNQWSAELNLPDVQYELWAGERGNRETLVGAAGQLRAGRVPQFAEPPFQRLASALEARARELAAVPVAEWPSVCRQMGESFQAVTPEKVASSREKCQQRLAVFAAGYPPIRDAENPWNRFLFWDEVTALASAESVAARDPSTLDRLEMRWSSAPAVWDDEPLYEASLAVREYLQQLRAELVGETAPQHAAAWNELAQLLENLAADPGYSAPVAAAVRRRESLGQSSPITASIRRELSRPNINLRLDAKWLVDQLRQPVEDTYDVNGVFAGTRSVGQGTMLGEMYVDILPSTAVGRWNLLFRGTSTARTRGSQDRVTVVSRATTKVAATKPFRLDERGLSPERASAGAVTSITYESIDSPGLPRRRSQAVSETYARRPQAERESAAYARTSILQQINDEAAKIAADFNRTFHAELRDPRITAGRPAPRIRVLADDAAVNWECLLEGPQSFGAATDPELYDCGAVVVMSVSPSALEEQAMLDLAGREMSGQELQAQMGREVEETSPAEEESFRVKFAPRPCEVRFVEGAVRVRLFVESFDAEEVHYPAMTVDATYLPEAREGRLVLLRQGRVRVKPLATAGDDAPKVSGRQQTLKLAVERKLSKVLTAELVGEDVELPLAGESETTMRVEHVRLLGDWLQLGLSPADSEPPAAPSG